MSVQPLAFIPEDKLEIPASVRALAPEEEISAVWVNGVGGVTYRVGAGTAVERFVKYAAAGIPESDFAHEAKCLAWVGQFVSVPRVLEQGQDAAGRWLVTRALAGTSAVAPEWIARPEIAARAVGAGLRILHDALPVDECPFSWSVTDRLAGFESRIAAGEDSSSWGNGYARYTVERAREILLNAPPVDKLVVCHGDACAPNTLLDGAGNFAAHVDMGEMGVADRWADLAVAAWSTEWNYGPGYEGLVYEAYGVEADTERIAYYRMLWDLT